MLNRDEASDVLSILAKPIMSAFGEARVDSASAREAMSSSRSRIAPPVLGCVDGVTYWALFSSYLGEEFAKIDRVEALPCHPFSNAWRVDGFLTVRLKSDTRNLPVDQLIIPGLDEVRRSDEEAVVLTWDHEREQRFDPAFVQIDGSREIWRLPVSAMLASPVKSIQPQPARAAVSSSRKVAEDDREGGAQN